MSNADLFDKTAPLSGDNFTYFRAYIAKQNGIGTSIFGDYDGTKEGFSKLSGDEQINLTNAMNAYIKANPQQATANQQSAANHAAIENLIPISTVEKITATDAAGVVIDTAYDLNKKFNPLAYFDSLDKLGKTFKIVFWIVAIGGGAFVAYKVYNAAKK